MKISLCLAGLLLTATAAFPQAAEVAIIGGVVQQNNVNLGALQAADQFGNVTNYTLGLGDGWRLGFRLTLNNKKYFGHEFGYAYNRSSLDYGGGVSQGFGIHQGFYNFLGYFIPEGRRVRPFATAGVHFNNYVQPGATAQYGQGSTKFGFNYGAGIKARVSDKFIIRFDIRQYTNPQPFGLPGASGWIRMNEYSAGFGIAL